MKPFYPMLLYGVILLSTPCLTSAEGPPGLGSESNVVAITSGFIDQLMDEARTNNPSLRAVGSRVRAATANVDSVRIWEDPTFSFGGSVYSARGMSPAQQGDLSYGIEQKLPLWNRPGLTKRMAEAAASVRRAGMHYRDQELRRDITKALLRVALAERVVAITEEGQAWLEITARVVESKYRTGEAVVADSLQVQNEVAEGNDRLRTSRLNVTHTVFSLNRVLNRSGHQAWPAIQLPPVAPPIPYSGKLVALTLRGEPRLLILAQEIKQAEAAASLARQSRLPEVSLGIEGHQYSVDGGFRDGTFMLRFSLPWWNSGKYREDYQREKERQKSVEEDRDDQALTVRDELHHLTVDLDTARRQALLYGDEVSVRASQALSSRLADWESGRGTLRDVFEARRAALDAQLMAVRSRVEQSEMLADLLVLTGLPNFEALIPLEHEPPAAAHDKSAPQ